MKQCPNEVEYRTHTTWWARCTREQGHLGACTDGHGTWTARVPAQRPATVEQNYDANGSPL